MKGIHQVIIQNKRIHFRFEVRRNITIICGDSATGKTTLIDMISEYINHPEDSGVSLSCDKSCYVLEGSLWQGQLSVIHDSIVFIDEGNRFISTPEFAEAIRGTDNYYVIVTRESLPALPYSVNEIYGIRMSGRFGRLQQVYNEFYPVYPAEPRIAVEPDEIITEDSNSGFDFFRTVTEGSSIRVTSANGKSNVFALASRHQRDRGKLLIVADGAAFGSEISKMTALVVGNPHIVLYLPESFEWILLKSDVLHDAEVREILANPSEHVESSRFFSWERFFTFLLISKTEGTWLHYARRQLNEAYTKGPIRQAVLQVMEPILIECRDQDK